MSIVKKGLLILSCLIVGLMLLTGCGGVKEEVQDSGAASVDQGYVNNDLLVSIDWLKENLSNENVLILDTRAEKEYQSAHIPGALNTPWPMFAQMDNGQAGDKNWGILKSKEDLSNVFSGLGIDNEKQIVVYADPNAWGEDGRIVWMLRMAGVTNSKILNGGWTAWKGSDGETTTEESQAKATEFTVTSINNSLTADTEWVVAHKDEIRIIDSRSEKEYDGATDYGEKRGGHIPDATLIPFKEVFNDDGTIKSQQELEQLFTDSGFNKDDTIITYCTKGIRSAHMALILRMIGYENVRNYDASFYDWAGNPELEVVTE